MEDAAGVDAEAGNDVDGDAAVKTNEEVEPPPGEDEYDADGPNALPAGTAREEWEEVLP